VACPKDCSGHGVCVSMADYARILADDPHYRVAALNESIEYGTANGLQTIAWDYDVMQKCICDSSWSVGYGEGQKQLAEYFGPDCSQSKFHYFDLSFPRNLSFSYGFSPHIEHCPSGNDPYTGDDETNCHRRSQLSETSGGKIYYILKFVFTVLTKIPKIFFFFLTKIVIDVQRGQLGNLCHVDCSNRGICDYSTGKCACFQGSWGEACESIANTGRGN
jgi:hypothetical protein